MKKVAYYIGFIILAAGQSFSEDAKFSDTIREQLIYPKPLIHALPNPVPEADTINLKILYTLEAKGFCSIKQVDNGKECVPTKSGESKIVPILNLANYKVSQYKVIIGEIDIDENNFRKDDDKITVWGKRVVTEKNELYDDIVKNIPTSDERNYKDQNKIWLIDLKTDIIKEEEPS